jgi:hypothetical protein
LLMLFDGFFGAAEDGTGFFFGFRPRLLGMGRRGGCIDKGRSRRKHDPGANQ